MIRIDQTNSPQMFAITCSELGILKNPFYLFVFTNDVTKNVQSIVLTDKSPNKERYNLFELIGSFFEGEGWHSYEVYEQDSFNNTALDMTNGLVEAGRLFVVSSFDVKFKQNENITLKFKEYDGR